MSDTLGQGKQENSGNVTVKKKDSGWQQTAFRRRKKKGGRNQA